MVRASASVLGGLALASTVVIVALLRTTSRPSVLSNSPSIDGIAHHLKGRAAALRSSAQAMETAALQRETEAAEDVAALKYLRQSQNELNAYAANLEGLVAVSGDGRFNAMAPQFPKEAAELHALIDHSLSRIDGISVRLSQNAQGVVPHHARSSARAMPNAHKRPVARRAVQAALKKTAQPISLASSKKSQATHAAQTPEEAKAQAVLAKLRRVKAFERRAEQAGAHTPRALSARGHTQMLVQPGPLHGALPVEGGALTRQGPLFDPKELGLDADDEDADDQGGATLPIGTPASWSDDATDYPQITWGAMLAAAKKNSTGGAAAGGNASNSTEPPAWNPADDPRIACNTTCQDAILHSVVGISYKVVKRCVPTCASSNYILRTYGAPLPSWTTVDELKEQDTKCRPDPSYQKCRLDLMKPVCLKFEEVMPQYCLSNPDVAVCSTCQELQDFMLAQKNAATGGKITQPANSECILGILC